MLAGVRLARGRRARRRAPRRADASRRSSRPAPPAAPGGARRRRPRRRDSSCPACTTGTCTSRSGRWCRAASTSPGADSAAAVAAIVAASVDRGEPEVIGFGYRDGLWPDAPTRAVLDAVSGDVPGRARRGRPARVLAEHRRGRGGTASGDRGGRERRAARGRLLPPRARARRRRRRGARRLGRRRGRARRRARRRGHHRLRDAVEPRRLGAARRRRHPLAARRRSASTPSTSSGRSPRACAPATRCPGTGGLVTVGGYKVITDGSLNTRTAWCFDPYPGLGPDEHPYGLATVPYDDLVPLMRRAHEAGTHARPCTPSATGRTPACSTRSRRSAARARSSTPSSCATTDVARFAALGVVASVQPEHAMDDRDVADRYWAGRTDRAFMLAELAAAGRRARPRLRRARGAARPVGRDRGGRRAHARRPGAVASRAGDRGAARRSPRRPAVAARRCAVGGPADLAVVELDPLAASVDDLRRMPVAATLARPDASRTARV